MKFAAVLFAGILIATPAVAQKLELKFDDLAARAKDKAEVDLDSSLLKMLLQGKGKGSKAATELPAFLNGVQEVHVRHYEFEKPGAWSDKDMEAVRKQVSGVAGWSRIANVKDKGNTAEIYVLTQGDKLGGALILAGEEKEFTVVHLQGTMTLAEMKEMVDSKIAYNLGGMNLLATPK